MVVLLGFLVYGFCGFVRQAGDFHVKTIRVEGADILREEAIIGQSGVTAETRILSLDTGAVTQELLKMPFIDTCRVSRVLPDKVVIQIRERVPVVTLLANSNMFVLDEYCDVLSELKPGQPRVGPFVTHAADLGCIEVGKRLISPALSNAVAVWRAFSKTGMARSVTVSEICGVRENCIAMYCDEFDCEVRWGRGDFDRQAWKLDLFWRIHNGQVGAKEYIDLRFADDIVCKEPGGSFSNENKHG